MSIREYLGSEIGRGGYGTIYMYKDNNSLCIKKTNKNNSCRVWSDEYNKMKKLIKNIGSENLDSLKYVKIIEPKELIEDEFGFCYMIGTWKNKTGKPEDEKYYAYLNDKPVLLVQIHHPGIADFDLLKLFEHSKNRKNPLSWSVQIFL